MPVQSQRFSLWVEACSHRLYRYACWLTRDTHTAEDLVQETYCRALTAADQLQHDQAACHWLLSILNREHARLYARERPEAMDIDFDSFESASPGIDTRPEAFVLRRAMKNLAQDYRQPLLLQVLYGYSCDEIAELLQQTSTTINNRLFRARQQIRQVLGEQYPSAQGAVS